MNYLARALAALVALSTHATPVFAEESPNVESSNRSHALHHLVAEQRNSLGLVGLGAMIMQDGELIASAVAGERKHRSGVLLTDQDKWHIGSITKSFTATAIARLVERGELTWETTIDDIFPDSAAINESWGEVTVEQLLTHTSGASSDLSLPLSSLFSDPQEGPDRVAARETLMLRFLKNEPESPPGSTWLYSNANFLIAGVIAEKVTGLSWEEFIRKEIFSPLDIQSGGFGHPKDQKGNLEQPRGHKSFLGLIVSADTNDDQSSVIGPAGTIHMTLGDLLIYANEHLQGEAGRGKLLKAETYQLLHKPVLNDYAYGWVVNPHEEWASGPVIWHNGSNGMWNAMLAILPSSNTIIAVTSNDRRNHSSYEMAWPMLEKAAQFLEPGKTLE